VSRVSGIPERTVHEFDVVLIVGQDGYFDT
jgi:hypothetical protein